MEPLPPLDADSRRSLLSYLQSYLQFGLSVLRGAIATGIEPETCSSDLREQRFPGETGASKHLKPRRFTSTCSDEKIHTYVIVSCDIRIPWV